MAATSRTPRAEPMISGTRWCGVLAESSRIRRRPVDGGAARPFHDQRHRMRFVQQAQPALAIAGPGVGRIEKHAATHQDAERLRDQRADPAHVEIRAAVAVGAGKAFVDVGADRPVPVPAIGRVDGEFRRIGRESGRPAPDQHELPRIAIENEDIDAAVERENERGLRAIDDEARGALRRAGLKEGRENVVAACGRIEKMVPTEMLFSRLADPSSGSIATQSGASGSSDFGQRDFLGHESPATGRVAQRAAHHRIGSEIDDLSADRRRD